MDPAKRQTAAFAPEHPRFRYKLWVRLASPEGVTYQFYWRRLAWAAGAAVVLAWLAAALAAWAFVKFRRGHDAVEFVDVAFYPLRQRQFRTGLGQHYIARGREELAQKNYLTGYHLLQAGLARVPEDLVARRLLAFTQVRLGRTDLALKTLADGAARSAEDLEFLKLLFGLLLEAQEDERIVQLSRTLLPNSPDQVRAHQYTALQAATAHHHRGRYDESDRLLTEWRLADAVEGQVLFARNDWERGRPELALVRLEGQLARFPGRDELYLELIRLNRHLGRTTETRRYALLRQLHDPTSPGPRVDLIQTYRAAGDQAAAQREIENYLTAFRTDAAALVLLAWSAVDSAQPALAARVHEIARGAQFNLTQFDLARTQAAIAARDYRAAVDFSAASFLASSGEDSPFVATLNGLRALAYYGLKDPARAEAALGSFLAFPRLRAADGILVARELRLLGAPAAARAVLDRACAVDPRNQAALAESIRLEAETGARDRLPDKLARYFQMRKPSRAILEEVLLRLDQPADAPLREQIRAALARVTSNPAP